MATIKRDIFQCIEKIIEILNTHNKNSEHVTKCFENLISTINFMAPEVRGHLDWVYFCELLNKLFPVTKKNMNEPFILEIQNILNPQNGNNDNNDNGK